MDRAKHIQELTEGFYVIQQKMLSKRSPIITGMKHVTFSQWRVLEIIDRQGKASIKKIHTALGITSSAATQLVNELAKKKYVSRRADLDDGRVSSVVLSVKMRHLLKTFKDQNLKKTIQLFKALNDREFKQYIDLHNKIIKNI